MLKKISLFILVVGVAIWLAQPGNGRKLGKTGGQMAEVGVSATGGFLDGAAAFFSGFTK